MNDRIRIQAICNLTNAIFPCSGYIEVLRVEDKETYAAWQMFNESGNIIAGVSQQYYLGDESQTRSKIIEMVLFNIKGFRIGRKHVFSNVKIMESEQL